LSKKAAAAAKGAAKAAAEARARKAHEAAAAAWAKVAAFWSPEGRGKNVNYYAGAQNAASAHHKKAGKNVDAEAAENAAADALMHSADALDKAGDPNTAKPLAAGKYTSGGQAAKAANATPKAKALEDRTTK